MRLSSHAVAQYRESGTSMRRCSPFESGECHDFHPAKNRRRGPGGAGTADFVGTVTGGLNQNGVAFRAGSVRTNGYPARTWWNSLEKIFKSTHKRIDTGRSRGVKVLVCRQGPPIGRPAESQNTGSCGFRSPECLAHRGFALLEPFHPGWTPWPARRRFGSFVANIGISPHCLPYSRGNPGSWQWSGRPSAGAGAAIDTRWFGTVPEHFAET